MGRRGAWERAWWEEMCEAKRDGRLAPSSIDDLEETAAETKADTCVRDPSSPFMP